MAIPTTSAIQQKRPLGLLLWWPAVVMLLGTVLSFLDRQVLALLSPTILQETHLTKQDYGIVIACFSYAYMVATLIWGPVLDRIGLRIGMTISIALWAVSSASHALISTFLGFAVARAALGLGEGAMFPGGFRTAMDTLPPEKQARGIGIAYSGSSLGAVIAPLIFIPIAARFGWRPAFLVTPVCALIWLVIWRFTVKPHAFTTQHKTDRMHFPNFLDRRFWSLVVSYGLGAMPVGVIGFLGPLYLTGVFHVTQRELGHILWIPPLGIEAGYFFWGYLSDRFANGDPRPVWLLFAMGLVGMACCGVAVIHSMPAAIAMMTITQFASGGLVVVTLRTGALNYGAAQRSMTAGIASSSYSAAVAILSPICGRWFDLHHYDRALIMVGLLPLVGVLMWWLLPVRRPAAVASDASPVIL